MKIQFNTDVHIHGTEALAAQVSASIEQALERFDEHITRVEVHLSDENAGKSGQHDQRCMLEARLEGRQPAAGGGDRPRRDAGAGGARRGAEAGASAGQQAWAVARPSREDVRPALVWN